MTGFEYEVREPSALEIETNEDGEKDWIGNTFFVGLNGEKVDKITSNSNEIIVLNFPGSGMAISHTGEEKCMRDAKNATEKTKQMISVSSVNAKFFTAVYENKADVLIHKYNNMDNIENVEDVCNPVKDIFNKTISPLLSDDYYVVAKNLNKLFLRGHCFGTVVVSQLEHLLKEKLKQTKFNEKQIEHLLSLPKVFISSPALSLENYPKYFKTTAIVNISDKTIAGGGKKDTLENIWRRNLRENLEEISGFIKEYRLPLKEEKDVITEGNYSLPNIEVRKVDKKYPNIKLYISNRGNFPNNFDELKKSIKSRMGIDENEKEAFESIVKIWENYIKSSDEEKTGMPKLCEAFNKQVKKWLKGHEYFFLPDELKQQFQQNFQEEFNEVMKTTEKDNMFDKAISNLNNDVEHSVVNLEMLVNSNDK
ncbi:MAG: hypothetical protein ACI4N3_01485 [Alphaproteobacteria bacterium]